jgi:hypothetical protein
MASDKKKPPVLFMSKHIKNRAAYRKICEERVNNVLTSYARSGE